MVKIFDDRRKDDGLIQFDTLDPGDIFELPSCAGLFLKIEPLDSPGGFHRDMVPIGEVTEFSSGYLDGSYKVRALDAEIHIKGERK